MRQRIFDKFSEYDKQFIADCASKAFYKHIGKVLGVSCYVISEYCKREGLGKPLKPVELNLSEVEYRYKHGHFAKAFERTKLNAKKYRRNDRVKNAVIDLLFVQSVPAIARKLNRSVAFVEKIMEEVGTTVAKESGHMTRQEVKDLLFVSDRQLEYAEQQGWLSRESRTGHVAKEEEMGFSVQSIRYFLNPRYNKGRVCKAKQAILMFQNQLSGKVLYSVESVDRFIRERHADLTLDCAYCEGKAKGGLLCELCQ